MSDRPLDPFDPDDLAGLEDLPEDDPRVAGAGPRTRAQLRAYRDFVAPGDVPEGARVAEAEERLARALERELSASATGGVPGRGASPVPRSEGFWTKLLGPRMRPALAFVALVVVIGGVWLARPARHAVAPVLRGSSAPSSANELASASVMRSDGSVRLEWLHEPRAQSYTLVFLSPELDEIARVPDLHETRFDLRPDARPAGLPAGPALWRVVAMRGVDEIARSKTAAITVP